MAESLDHSPADIIRWLLVQLGQGADPPASPWPVYAGMSPSRPDNLITVFDTTGMDHGRTMDGERQAHHGVQVRIRCVTDLPGYRKARAVALALDGVYNVTVTIGTATYLVHSFNRTGEVLVLGKESPDSKRSLFTVNGLTALRML